MDSHILKEHYVQLGPASSRIWGVTLGRVRSPPKNGFGGGWITTLGSFQGGLGHSKTSFKVGQIIPQVRSGSKTP